MRFLIALASAILPPAAAFAAAAFLFAQTQPGLSITQALSAMPGFVRWMGPAAMSEAELYAGFGALAVIVAAAGVALLLFFKLAAFVLGAHRMALAAFFPSVAFWGVIATALIVFSQVSLLAATLYFLARGAFPEQAVIIGGALALGAVGLGLSVAGNLSAFFKKGEASVIGVRVDEGAHPRLALLIREVAKEIKAKPPKNVVLGLDPTFFATSARVATPFLKEPLKGRTLYLSAPILRALSEGELRAIVGHELGHFSGGDTFYTNRFAPVYRSLLSAGQGAISGGGIWWWLGLPAAYMVGDMVGSFAHAERRISRKREFRADQLGAKASSPEDVAYSLMKMSILASVWNGEMGIMIDRIKNGRISRNLSRNFVERLRYDLDRSRVGPWVKLALDDEVAHPTDTHPKTEHRIAAVGGDIAVLTDEEKVLERFFPPQAAADRIDDLQPVEEALTHVFHELAFAQGIAERPNGDGVTAHEAFLNVLNLFLAYMVTADGVVDDREIEIAERQGYEQVAGFDNTGFREACRHPEDLPELDKLIEFANRLLKPGGAQMLKDMLKKIAHADGEYHDKERALFERLEVELVGSEGD